MMTSDIDRRIAETHDAIMAADSHERAPLVATLGHLVDLRECEVERELSTHLGASA